jgi:hypothetical protein
VRRGEGESRRARKSAIRRNLGLTAWPENWYPSLGKRVRLVGKSFRAAGISLCRIMKAILFRCLPVVSTVFFVASLSAQIPYNSRTTYDAAHPSSYVIDFNNRGPSGTFYPGGLTEPTPFGNVTFDGIHTPPPDTGAVEAVDANVFGVAGTGNLVLGVPGGQFLGDSLLITLPANLQLRH